MHKNMGSKGSMIKGVTCLPAGYWTLNSGDKLPRTPDNLSSTNKEATKHTIPSNKKNANERFAKNIE